MRSWPEFPTPINRAHPLGDASFLTFLCGGGLNWYDGANDQWMAVAPQQTITLGTQSSGTFTLTLDGVTSGGIAYNATGATGLAAALAAMSSYVGRAQATGAAGGPYTLTAPGKVGSLFTANFAGLTTPGNASIATTGPTAAPSGVILADTSFPWRKGSAVDTYPGGVSRGTMRCRLLHRMFTAATAGAPDYTKTGITNGWSQAMLFKPHDQAATLQRQGDYDTSDMVVQYVGNPSGGVWHCALTRTAANASNTPSASLAYPAGIPWIFAVRSVSQNSVKLYANMNAAGTAQLSYMLLQTASPNDTTDADLRKTWESNNSGGGGPTTWIYPNGTGPNTVDAGRAQTQLGYFATWPHPLTKQQVDDLYLDPWLMCRRAA